MFSLSVQRRTTKIQSNSLYCVRTRDVVFIGITKCIWRFTFEFFTIRSYLYYKPEFTSRGFKKFQQKKVASSGSWTHNTNHYCFRSLMPCLLCQVTIWLSTWIFNTFTKSCSVDSRNYPSLKCEILLQRSSKKHMPVWYNWISICLLTQ